MVNSTRSGEGLITVLLREGKGYRFKKQGDTKTYVANAPPLAEVIEEMYDSARKTVRKLPPRAWVILKGFDAKERTAVNNVMQGAMPDDNVTINCESKEKQDVAIESTNADSRTRIDPIIGMFNDSRIIGLQMPIMRLFLESGFTEASARVAQDFMDRKMELMQRFIKRRDEQEVFRPFVLYELAIKKEMGWKAAIERFDAAALNWNWAPVEKRKVSTTELIQLLQIQLTMWQAKMITQPIVSPEEMRKIFIDAGLPLGTEQNKKGTLPTVPQQQAPKGGQPPSQQ